MFHYIPPFHSIASKLSLQVSAQGASNFSIFESFSILYHHSIVSMTQFRLDSMIAHFWEVYGLFSIGTMKKHPENDAGNPVNLW